MVDKLIEIAKANGATLSKTFFEGSGIGVKIAKAVLANQPKRPKPCRVCGDLPGESWGVQAIVAAIPVTTRTNP